MATDTNQSLTWTLKTKDGLEIPGIPASIDPNSPEARELVAQARARYAQEQADSAAKAQAAAPPAAPEQSFVDRALSAAADMAPGIVRGAAPIAGAAALGAAAGAPFGGVGALPGAVEGAALMAGVQLLGDPAAAIINSIAGEQIVRGPTEVIGDVLDNIGLPRPETAAGRMAQATAQGVAGAGGMMAVGKTLSRAASPVLQSVGEGMMANAPAQIGGGAGGGLASQGAAELGANPITQIGAGLVGGIGGAKLGGLANVRPVAIDQATGLQLPRETARRVAAMQEAEAIGIPVRTSDIFPPTTLFGKLAKAIGDKMPMTTGKMNAQQAAARQQAIEDFFVEAGATGKRDVSLGKATENLLKNRQSDLAKYIANKADVISRANEFGNVNTSATIAEIDRRIAALSSMRDANTTGAIKALNNLRTAISDQTLENVERSRKLFGANLKDVNIGEAEKQLLKENAQKIYSVLNSDMKRHIATALDEPSANKWAIANKRLSAMMDEIGEAQSRDILSVVRRGNADPGKIERILFNGTPSDIRTAYKYMDNEGRAAARRAYVDKAIEAATGGRALEGVDPVSVDKFKNAYATAIKNGGPFFEGVEGLRAKGLIRALDLTVEGPRANQLAQTGAMGIPLQTATLAGSALGLTKALLAFAGGSTVARTYQSPGVRDALIRLAKTEKGSPEEYAAINRLIAQTQNQTRIVAQEDRKAKK